MYRLTSWLAGVFILILMLTSCQGNQISSEDLSDSDESMTIVTSFYPVYIATINVTKDVPGINVVNMTQTTDGCLHDYQLKPEDLKTLSVSQVFVVNGAGAETFIDKVVNQMPNVKIVDAGAGIPLIEEGIFADDNHHAHHHDEESHGYNPHIWVSISNAIQQVKNIQEQLSEINPENTDKYELNAGEYQKRLEALRAEMFETINNVPNKDIITFHESFSYFAKEFGLNIVAVIEGEDSGSQPSAAKLGEIIEIIKRTGIKSLFAEPQYFANSVETISRETGAEIYYLDPAVSGPDELDAYVKIMEANMVVLKEALK